MNQEFYINQEDWDKMQHYAQAAYDTEKSEIGGILIAEQDKDDDWELKDPVIIEQEISGGNCILDKEALARYYTKVGSDMQDKPFRFVWWHSHHNMAAFWSSTDLATINEEKNSDFSFALVINLREEYKFRVSVWKPFEVHTDIEINILSPAKTVPDSILKEVADKCSTTKYTYTGWKQHKGKNPQLSLINPTEYSYGGDEADYNYAYRTLDRLLARYCDGTIQYHAWVQQVNAINAKLQSNWNSIYEVELVTESVLESKAVMCTPHEFIVLNTKDAYQDYRDLQSWNNSYGVE